MVAAGIALLAFFINPLLMLLVAGETGLASWVAGPRRLIRVSMGRKSRHSHCRLSNDLVLVHDGLGDGFAGSGAVAVALRTGVADLLRPGDVE